MCAACAATLRPAPALPPPPGVDRCHALLAYDGAARDVVARIKYRNQRAAVTGLAAAMAASLTGAPDVVTWAPTTADRRRARGFDHAELLARAVARQLHRPCHGLLVRRPGPAQTGQPVARRRLGPGFDAGGPVASHVLVVDDVITSGATLAAAAAALHRAGARRVDAVAAARTPPPNVRSSAQDDHAA